MEIDRENISGHMPEDREMPEYCPVRNFETYLQYIHKLINIYSIHDLKCLWMFFTLFNKKH
jgi:hypothetical protein